MSYSMIVIDDEKIIRDGLEKFIRKTECEFDVVQTFEDGIDAVKFLEENRVDLVLTDICMTEMSGLDVAKYVQEKMPDTELVVLSGYRDFEYAQQAISCGVARYLVKPVKNSEIIDTLNFIKGRLDEKRKLQSIKSHHDEMLEQLRDNFFVDLMFGTANVSKIEEKAVEFMEFSCPIDEIYADVLHISWSDFFMDDVWKYEKDKVNTIILNYFSSRENNVLAIVVNTEQFLILSLSDTIDKDIEQLHSWAKETFGAYPVVDNLYSCKGLKKLAEYKRASKGGITPQTDVDTERQKLLYTYINLGMYDEGKSLFIDILNMVGNVAEKADKLIRTICENASKIGVEMDADIYSKRLNSSPQACADVFVSICDYFNTAKNEDKIITQIKDYVHSFYAMDISLETAAASVYLHPVYLSRFFKQHVGENFSDYLYTVRMTKAITLLKSNKYKVYEVSEKVGYKSSKYFSRQFKNYTGYTPKNYCRIMWNLNVRD